MLSSESFLVGPRISRRRVRLWELESIFFSKSNSWFDLSILILVVKSISKKFKKRHCEHLLPMHFQLSSNALQNHGLDTIHQGVKFFCDNSVVLSNTGILCWHVNDLWLWNKTGPARFQFLDHMILDFFYFLLGNLVPLVAHKQRTLGWDRIFLSFKRHSPHFFKQLFKLQMKGSVT